MAFRQFLQHLFERLGLAEPPAPPPQAVELQAADFEQIGPMLARVSAWGVRRTHLATAEDIEPGELVQGVGRAVQFGMQVTVRGKASDLLQGTVVSDLVAAGASEIEIPFLSAIGEVHDSLAGAGDYRSALRIMDSLASRKVPFAAQIVVAPSTRKTIGQTLQFLDDRGVREVRLLFVACRDEEPSSWAIAACELPAVVQSIEQSATGLTDLSWYPPLKFDPSRTLAQQVRRGPRASADAIRIEPDGNVLLPIGPAISVGNALHEDWESIARGVAFRAFTRHRAEEKPCEVCPALKACKGGCLRDGANWVQQ